MKTETNHSGALLPLLRAAGQVVVISHTSPDGDAVSALLALSASLRLARFTVRPLSPSPVPASYRFLPGWEEVAVYDSDAAERPDGCEAERAIETADAIVCVDCSDLERLGPLYVRHRDKFRTAVLVNIDHHATNSGFGRLNLVDPSAASVCEYLALLMEREDLPLTAEIASALLTGVVADTLGFRTTSTSANTLRVAASLMERGATLSDISQLMFNTRSPRTLCLWGNVLSRTRVEDRLVWADITAEMLRECGATLEDADRLVDFIAGVPETRGAFLFSEHQGEVRVSVRTSADLDAAALAQVFGGGGHARAAGCTLQGPLDDARALVMAEARRRLPVAVAAEEQS